MCLTGRWKGGFGPSNKRQSTKQTRSFQIGANALAEENQKDGVKSIWILDVI